MGFHRQAGRAVEVGRRAQRCHCPPSQIAAPVLEAFSSFLPGLTYTLDSTDHGSLVLISFHHILDVFLKTQNLQHVPVDPIGAACRSPQHLEDMGGNREGRGIESSLSDWLWTSDEDIQPSGDPRPVCKNLQIAKHCHRENTNTRCLIFSPVLDGLGPYASSWHPPPCLPGPGLGESLAVSVPSWESF